MSKSYFLPRKSKFYGFGLSVLLSFSWSGFFGCAETARKTANNPSVSNALSSESKADPSLNKSSQTAKKTKKDAKRAAEEPKAKKNRREDTSDKKESLVSQPQGKEESASTDPSENPSEKDSESSKTGEELAKDRWSEGKSATGRPEEDPKPSVSRKSDPSMPSTSMNKVAPIRTDGDPPVERITKVPSSQASPADMPDERKTTQSEVSNQSPLSDASHELGHGGESLGRRSISGERQENATDAGVSEMQTFFAPRKGDEKMPEPEEKTKEVFLVEPESRMVSSPDPASLTLRSAEEKGAADSSVATGFEGSESLEVGLSSLPGKLPVTLETSQRTVGYSDENEELGKAPDDRESKYLGFGKTEDSEPAEGKPVSPIPENPSSQPSYLRLQEFIKSSTPNDFSSKQPTREYSKLSVWTKSKEDENGTVVPKLRGDRKRFGKALQWIRDKGRSED